MTKKDLVVKLSETAEIAKKDAESYINTLLDTITETLATGEEVNIHGFGKFEVKERAERKGRNPQDGSELIVPACKNVKFKALKGLKEAVNQ